MKVTVSIKKDQIKHYEGAAKLHGLTFTINPSSDDEYYECEIETLTPETLVFFGSSAGMGITQDIAVNIMNRDAEPIMKPSK